MANLFEINRAITDAWAACVDPETGEVNDELYAQFEALEMERDAKIEGIACLNMMSVAGINSYNYSSYLKDGVHDNTLGGNNEAKLIEQFMLEYFMYKSTSKF